MRESFRAQMEEEFKQLDISLSEHQMEQFFQYYEMLVERNRVMNLTAITEEAEVITKHFVDSVSLVKVMPELRRMNGESGAEKPISLIDVGTGAGFPGIPLKIAFPECRVTLLDSLNKRVKFLQEVADTLGLSDVNAIHGRAEDFGQNENYREQFDCCVSRAVANLATLSEYCMPFVKTGGAFISYKSGEIEEEVKAAEHAVKLLNGKIKEVYPFSLPGTDMKRSFVVIGKEGKLHKKYPRKAGLPSKEPLK
ncbi:MAG: 16S rRNA (guanine(527)-N(7))-methyltransferase RsmG [Lachnospiraceae bacterium]|nr:16S rRNA (guanine(527)-N(7))-methyltransferase RsmG [Lachnospiraceae bacterium]